MDKTTVPVKKIFALGLLVGTFDILSAIIDTWLSYGWMPDKVLKYIAGAAFDTTGMADTFQVVAGLVFHYLIALGFTFLFYFLYPTLKKALRFNLLIAVLYGVFMQAVMRLLVLPMTRLHLPPFNAAKQLKATLILIVAIGLPLSLLVPRLLRNRKNAAVETSPKEALARN